MIRLIFLCEKFLIVLFIVYFPHFYNISCISEDAMIDKPVQCVKLLSLSPASVNVRLFYENNLSAGTFEEFAYDGRKSQSNETTICKELTEEMDNRRVISVNVQRDASTSTEWHSAGVLVQNTPGGKFGNIRVFGGGHQDLL